MIKSPLTLSIRFSPTTAFFVGLHSIRTTCASPYPWTITRIMNTRPVIATCKCSFIYARYKGERCRSCLVQIKCGWNEGEQSSSYFYYGTSRKKLFFFFQFCFSFFFDIYKNYVQEAEMSMVFSLMGTYSIIL